MRVCRFTTDSYQRTAGQNTPAALKVWKFV